VSLLLGAHVSAAGGTPAAPARAGAIKATAMQIFTKQGNRWAERECDDCEQDEQPAGHEGKARASCCGRLSVDHPHANVDGPRLGGD